MDSDHKLISVEVHVLKEARVLGITKALCAYVKEDEDRALKGIVKLEKSIKTILKIEARNQPKKDAFPIKLEDIDFSGYLLGAIRFETASSLLEKLMEKPIIFVGDAGCGKTVLARALSNHFKKSMVIKHFEAVAEIQEDLEMLIFDDADCTNLNEQQKINFFELGMPNVPTDLRILFGCKRINHQVALVLTVNRLDQVAEA